MSKANEHQAYPELKAVLDHQASIATLSQQVQSIDAAIADQEQKLADARERRPSSEPIGERRQALFAAEALGQVTKAERETREAEIDREAAEIKKRWASTDQGISRMEAALAGLRGQREKTSEQLQALHAMTHELLELLIVAEAEKVCADYVDVALMVKERFLQLMSLSSFLVAATQTPTSSRSSPRRLHIDPERLFIPNFQLPQCMETAHPNARSRLVSAEYLDYSGAEQEERGRLRALGVTLI